MNILSGLISGLISGILASLIAQIIIRATKPKIRISNNISKQLVDGSYEYRFKVVNLSKSYAKNLIISPQLITTVNAQDGPLITTKPLPLMRKDIKFIAPYNKRDGNSTYAVRFRLNCNLEEIWEEDDYTSLEITVFCENEQNGCGKMFQQLYRKKDTIVEGSFKTGKSTDIS